jgi:hypothetical protein
MDDLFGFTPGFLPSATDGETLFGWCARFHRLSGNTSGGLTSKELFGHLSGAQRSDFPVGLGHFVDVTRGTLGSALAILRERTVFGHFLPFLDQTASLIAIENICNGSTSRIKGPLGLLKGGHEIPLRLKACPDCQDEDLSRLGVATWHLSHQWPSSWVCLRHCRSLRIAVNSFIVQQANSWCLPGDLREKDWQATEAFTPSQSTQLFRLAEWTQHFAAQFDRHYLPHLLRHTYLVSAKARGWIALDGTLRFRTLCNAFLDAYRGLETLPGLELLNDVAKNHGGFLGLLLRSYAGHRVPAKHFLLMTFLFDTPEEFEAAYEQARAVFESDGEVGLQRQLTDLRERLTHMVENEGSSINHAAEVLGIPPGMAVRAIRTQDIPYQRRPRVLNAEREAKLVALLKAGEPREAIAAALSIRRSFIKDYLATHEELLSQWQTAFDNRNREAHRTRFLLTLSNNPDLPIKRIRRLPTNGFQWLYNNDREWLLQQLPSLWSR